MRLFPCCIECYNLGMKPLHDYIDSLPILSTHEHHYASYPPGEGLRGLEYLFHHSYVRWHQPSPSSKSDRARFLDLMCGNSYFVWYEKALDDLFDFGGEITVKNWDSINDRIDAALATPGFHDDVWANKCGYTRAIQDSYWDPGSDNGRPDLYSPAFRINSFLFGSCPETADHNLNNAQSLYGRCDSLDEYLAMIDRVIAEKKAAGCVALKSALAYDRSLDFKPHSRRTAEKVFGKPPSNVAPDELKTFGDFIFDHICELAAKYDLPFQNHTGLGRLGGSNPMNLIPMIERHPETKFVLFHGGYPWVEQVAALSHNYANVYVDLCWLPIICTSAAERALHSLIEAGRDSSRVAWGGDCWIVTESYAASLAMRQVLKKALSEKTAAGYLTESRARRFAERILSENAKCLYGLR